MNRYERQVADVLAAVAVRGPTRFAWLGRLSAPIEAPLEAAMDADAHRDHLCRSLAERLRSSWYCHGRPLPAAPSPAYAFGADRALVAALSDANAGHGTWQGGWTVERLDGDVAVSSDGGLRARISLADCRALDRGPRPGAPIAVRLPKELPFYSPGFHTLLGDADLDGGVEQVRVYWHVTASGAAELVRALTSRLNAAAVPFELKVASHPLELQRCDAAVLYLPAARFVAARALLAEVAGELAVHLRPTIPALTLALAPGVGLAESIRGPVSFGSLRCKLLADGIVRGHEQGLKPLSTVSERFAEAGVALDAPYLEPALTGRHVL